ncbi:MAG: macro domain-containing protein [Acidobacteria bacterium]|nr:macro domain-containing protein [Acidobacteriota bacterium]MYI75159.1 macro domain-containing protein [Acidobacteriota bacterium]
MIHYVSGDILLSRAQALAHGVAPMDPMNQGLARSLHEKYPAMHKDYHHWCNQMHPKPGEAWMWGGTGGVRVINLITQEGGYGHGSRPGRATLKHVRDSLRALVRIVEREGFRSLALPRLATGVGGLKWADVRPVVEDRLGALKIPVYVYSEFHAGQQADEPRA